MRVSAVQDERIAKMSFAKVYPLYLAKIEKKGRTKEELDQIICWFSGLSVNGLQALIAEEASFHNFFATVVIPAEAELITGLICGIRVETIENPLTRKVRQLDKIVDELAKGRKLEKIIRT